MASYADPSLRVIDIIMEHMKIEFTNDVDLIMGTVASNPRYVVTKPGEPLLILQDTEGVRGMYSTQRDEALLIEERSARRVLSDWYLFGESNATFRYRGEFEGVDRSGLEYNHSLAVLLPVGTEDALLGEFIYWPTSVAEAVRARLAGTTLTRPDLAARAAQLHGELLSALQAADIDRLPSIFAPDASLITRDFDDPNGKMLILEGVDAISKYFDSLLTSASGVQVALLTFIPSEQFGYAFAEHCWQFTDESGSRTERRVATLYTCDDSGLLHTCFGYGKS